MSLWAADATQVVTGVAGFSYAFGWVLTARFYGEFGVDPESAGVTFGWLAIRAFLVGLASLGIFLVARGVARFATAVPDRPARLAGPRLAAVTVGGCLAVAVVVLLVRGTLGSPVSPGEIITAVAVALVTAFAVLFGLRPELIEARPRLGQIISGLAGFLIGFAVVALLLTPYRLGAHLADDIRAGRPVSLPIVPGVPALQAPRTRLSLVEPGVVAPEVRPFLGCVIRLGGANGVSLYYADGRVLRVADEIVHSVSSC
ncbi:hypothetical protein [Actinoplanes sp. RD1]|uniref:hypothetical protein n=1 Tax=Actinoplanes sp. RD1 TaxID=3064538 RepID=UPI00274173D7|nr:hypothetical protein [Actinoplanes sp. RD1]